MISMAAIDTTDEKNHPKTPNEKKQYQVLHGNTICTIAAVDQQLSVGQAKIPSCNVLKKLEWTSSQEMEV